MISSFATIGNYDYGFFWYLYQDGTIEFEVKLTGVLSTGGRGARARRREHGDAGRAAASTRWSTSTSSTSGSTSTSTAASNAVDEVGRESLPPGPDNPYGNAFRAVPTPLRARAGGAPRTRPARRRDAWQIVNPDRAQRAGRAGRPTGWCPGDNAVPFAQPDAPGDASAPASCTTTSG